MNSYSMWINVNGNPNIIDNGCVDYWQMAIEPIKKSSTAEMIDNIIEMKTYKYRLDTKVMIRVTVSRSDGIQRPDYFNYGTIVSRSKGDSGNVYSVAFHGGAQFDIPERGITRASVLDQLLYF